MLRARAVGADRSCPGRPPLAQAGALRGRAPAAHGRVPVLLGARPGGARSRRRPDPRQRHRARALPLHVPGRAGASPGDPARLPAPRRRGPAAAAPAAGADDAGRDRSPATAASPTPGATAPRSRPWPACTVRAGSGAGARRGAGAGAHRHAPGGARPGWPPTSPSCRAVPPTDGCAPRSSTPRMRVCGNRFGRGWLRPGGVRHAPERRRCDATCCSTLAAFAQGLRRRSTHLMLGGAQRAVALPGHWYREHRRPRRSSAWSGWSRAPAAWRSMPAASLPGRLYDRPPHRAVDREQRRLLGAPAAAHARDRCSRCAGSTQCWHARAGPERRLAARAGAAAARHAVRLGARRLPRPGGAGAGDRRGRAPACTTRCRTRRCSTGSASRWRCATTRSPTFPICNKSFDLSYCGNDL